jgi:hypothetical protein
MRTSGACFGELEHAAAKRTPSGILAIGRPRERMPDHAECYCRAVPTILLVGVDLFFRGKLETLLPGHRFVTSDSVHAPDLVIADIARVEPDEVVDAWPDVPIVGFTNHTDRAGLRRAHTAGFDQVIVKSALVERAPELVAELTT